MSGKRKVAKETGVNVPELKRATATVPISYPERPNKVTAEEALRDLFELLEEYSPTWYTEEHRNKAAAALRIR